MTDTFDETTEEATEEVAPNPWTVVQHKDRDYPFEATRRGESTGLLHAGPRRTLRDLEWDMADVDARMEQRIAASSRSYE